MPTIKSTDEAKSILDGKTDIVPPGTKLDPIHKTGVPYQARSTPDEAKQKPGSAASTYHARGARGRAYSFLASDAVASGDIKGAMDFSQKAQEAFELEANGRGAEKGKVGGTDGDTHQLPYASARADEAHHKAKYHEFKDIWSKHVGEQQEKRQAIIDAHTKAQHNESRNENREREDLPQSFQDYIDNFS